MERKKYRCSGCGKVIIGDALPGGWNQEWVGLEQYLCDQCHTELKPLHLPIPG
jgi:DNA-directed RNA polymerase subunit RPC12/RpoP